MRIGRKAVIAAGLGVILAIGVLPGVAHASEVSCVDEGLDRACATNFTSGGSYIVVCDHEADGNGVYAEFMAWGGAVTTIADANGSASGCGSKNWGSKVLRIRICEDDWGSDTCVTEDF